MNKYIELSDSDIHKIWSGETPLSDEEIREFRKELVKRGFVSWDEINTKWDINGVDKK